MARFFTADLHLGHRSIARYEPERARAAGVAPLDGPADEETQSRLDSFLIDRWNEVVGPEDEVWMLGDACMGRLDHTIEHLRRLHGRIVLVPGNHDRVWAGDHRREQWWDHYLNAGIDDTRSPVRTWSWPRRSAPRSTRTLARASSMWHAGAGPQLSWPPVDTATSPASTTSRH